MLSIIFMFKKKKKFKWLHIILFYFFLKPFDTFMPLFKFSLNQTSVFWIYNTESIFCRLVFRLVKHLL